MLSLLASALVVADTLCRPVGATDAREMANMLTRGRDTTSYEVVRDESVCKRLSRAVADSVYPVWAIKVKGSYVVVVLYNGVWNDEIVVVDSLFRRPSRQASPKRLAIAPVMETDSIGWLVAERASRALRARLDSTRTVVVQPARIRAYLADSRYGNRSTTAEVREVMKAMGADVFVDVQVARSNGRVIVSVHCLEMARSSSYRGPLYAASTVDAAADSLAARIIIRLAAPKRPMECVPDAG